MVYPIYEGADVKFQITTEFENFQLTEDDFKIVIKDRWGRTRCTIVKDDCFYDSDGRYYFTIENVRNGIYQACFFGKYEDNDYDKQKAVITDKQQLFVVPSCVDGCNCGNNNQEGCKCQCSHGVHYMLVTTVSVDGEDYLCGSDGKYIFTSDGKRISFKSDLSKKIDDMGKVILDTMTGEEFKQFIEGRKPDGTINTVQEILDATQGIGDESTIKQEIEKDIDETEVERVTQEDLANFEV